MAAAAPGRTSVALPVDLSGSGVLPRTEHMTLAASELALTASTVHVGELERQLRNVRLELEAERSKSQQYHDTIVLHIRQMNVDAATIDLLQQYELYFCHAAIDG